jgi:hypothetical protein
VTRPGGLTSIIQKRRVDDVALEHELGRTAFEDVKCNHHAVRGLERAPTECVCSRHKLSRVASIAPRVSRAQAPLIESLISGRSPDTVPGHTA